MSLCSLREPTTADLATRFQATTESQLDSTFFGRLPLEIREMIYAECWVVSGVKQHVFRIKNKDDESRLAHCPCVLGPAEADPRNDEMDRMMCTCHRMARLSRGFVVKKEWVPRFASTWNDHWRCEEEEEEKKKKEEEEEKKKKKEEEEGVTAGDQGRPRTLFLPILLTCKRMYMESLRSLYSTVTLVFTDLSLAHAFLVRPAMSRTRAMTTPLLLTSLHFSLAVPFDTLHQHRLSEDPHADPGPWAELCTALSDLVRFAALRRVSIRLDLADDAGGDRFWWQVRERWILSPVRGMLARRLTVYLPETTHVEWSRPYQYADDGGGGDESPPFRLERYPPRRWVRDNDDGGGLVKPRYDPPRLRSQASDMARWERFRETTRLRKARRGLRRIVNGLRSEGERAHEH
ncbi:hypothetical protein F4778DRAFT_387922 [Xylariomycetidae sp. FL2044]|nr:hypothetical protein F4778DRAFT_387922 [Xylariomycetidae sp. FL2044]